MSNIITNANWKYYTVMVMFVVYIQYDNIRFLLTGK